MSHQIAKGFVAAVILVLASQSPGSPCAEATESDFKRAPGDETPMVATAKVYAIYSAGSAAKGRGGAGFAPSENVPRELVDQEWGAKGSIALVAFPEETIAGFTHRRFKLRLVNRTGEELSFPACDSALPILAEAQDGEGVWREIEYGPSQRKLCGNSFHKVFLGPNQYWEFSAQAYAGPMRTKIRYRFHPGGDRPVVYSNEFDGQVAPEQFRGSDAK